MNNVEKMLAKYEYYTFESSMYETPEFKDFCTKLKNSLQKDIKTYFPDLEISEWTKMHFEVSGFITRKTDGAIFYFSVSDVRGSNVAKKLVLYRSARHLKDYLGGRNLYCLAGELLENISKERYEFKEENLKTLNKDIKRRDEIIFGSYEWLKYGGGIRHFENLNLGTLKLLIDENFVDIKEKQNNCPSIGEILKFMEKYPAYTAHGYVVDISRSDYRLSLEGVYKPSKADSDIELMEFEELFGEADEINTNGEMHCWFD